MKLTPLMERYVLHWGEMGTRWGVNRTVAQIHALLYLSPRPLAADEIVETLGVARSNVSTSLKELQAWGLVTIAHVLGDRRDHFTTRGDTWTMLTTIVEELKRRELEPTLSLLRLCVLEADGDRDTPPATKARIEEMLDFVVQRKGLAREDAYLLLSAAMDLVVTQAVDGTKGIHAILPKSIFRESAASR